jgi:hypothetical protein
VRFRNVGFATINELLDQATQLGNQNQDLEAVHIMSDQPQANAFGTTRELHS